MLFSKPINKLEENDLRQLIGNTREIKTLDYKQAVIENTDSDKKEFLADVTSFANASGGHIILGMEEAGGMATSLPGITSIDPDKEILRLEEIIRNGVEPRIYGIAIELIKLANGNYAFIIHIPKSWASPHMVTFRGTSRFYARNSTGKYQLDVHELRHAFLLTEGLNDKIQNFRLDRIGKIIADEAPLPLPEGAKTVIHIVPLNSLDILTGIDIASLRRSASALLTPMASSGWNGLINFDGFLSYAPMSDGKVYSYLQIMRDGAIEAFGAAKLDPTIKVINPTQLEAMLIEAITDYLRLEKEILQTEPPFILMLSLLQVKGYSIEHRVSGFSPDGVHRIEKDVLLLPDIWIESFESDIPTLMKPMFDMIWNAAGWPRSMSYSPVGEWKYTQR